MKKNIKISIVIFFILSGFVYSQTDSIDCCPKEFTGKRIGVPKIFFEKFVVADSLKYSIKPKIIDSISIVLEKLNETLLEIQNKDEEGIIVSSEIDSSGLVISCKLILGWDEKLDNTALEAIKYLKFEPATIGEEKVPSRVILIFGRTFIALYDEPSSLVSAITLEHQSGQILDQWKLTIKSDLSAYYENVVTFVNYPDDPKFVDSTLRYKSTIDEYTYKRLNSLIHSICFFSMEDEYGSQHPHAGRLTLSVTLGNRTKSIRIKSDEPVGLWALKKLIYYLKDNIIKWEQIN
jgi:hypothetical protein